MRYPQGAMGLMQLMPQTARSLNVNNLSTRNKISMPGSPFKEADGELRGRHQTESRGLQCGSRSRGAKCGDTTIAETQNYVKRITQLTTRRQHDEFARDEPGARSSANAAG